MIPYAPCREKVGGGGAGGGSDPRASGPSGGAGRWVRRRELRRQGETGARGMSAHHVVTVDAVRGVLHAVVDFPPEHRQVLGEPVREWSRWREGVINTFQ